MDFTNKRLPIQCHTLIHRLTIDFSRNQQENISANKRIKQNKHKLTLTVHILVKQEQNPSAQQYVHDITCVFARESNYLDDRRSVSRLVCDKG